MPDTSEPTAREWLWFSADLAKVLASLGQRHHLIISVKGYRPFVQFAVGEDRSIRAEAASNQCLEDPGAQLKVLDYRTMDGLNWHRPTTRPQEFHDHRDDQDGSPNFFLDLEPPIDFRGLARVAVATFRIVYRVRQLGDLEYDAFRQAGGPIRLPTLGIASRRPELDDEPTAEGRPESPVHGGSPVNEAAHPGRKMRRLPTPLELPPRIQAAVDQLLMRFDGRTRIAGGLGYDALVSWLDRHFDDLELGLSGYDTPTPIIPQHEGHALSDSGRHGRLAEDLFAPSFGDDDRIIQIDRHLRGLLRGKIERGAGAHPACGFAVIRSFGRQAVIGYGVQGSSSVGPAIEWYGMFAQPDHIWDELRRRGWLFDAMDLDNLSRAAKLALWNRG